MTPALFHQHHNQPWPLPPFVRLRHGVDRYAAGTKYHGYLYYTIRRAESRGRKELYYE